MRCSRRTRCARRWLDIQPAEHRGHNIRGLHEPRNSLAGVLLPGDVHDERHVRDLLAQPLGSLRPLALFVEEHTMIGQPVSSAYQVPNRFAGKIDEVAIQLK
jgi:hypothetical protein